MNPDPSGSEIKKLSSGWDKEKTWDAGDEPVWTMTPLLGFTTPKDSVGGSIFTIPNLQSDVRRATCFPAASTQISEIPSLL
jgi:hypothetical protein